MKSKLTTVLLCTLAFFLSLEVISWILLSADVKPQVVRHPAHVVWKRADMPIYLTDQSRIGKNLRKYIAWEEKHPEVKVPLKGEGGLISEPSRYENRGVKKGKNLYSRFETLNPNLSDDFELYGADSGKLKYSIHYETDSVGRRMTGYETRPKAKLNLIFIGCSFTFGEGVPMASSFTAVVGSLFPHARIYNLGVPGSSPGLRLLALKKNKSLLKEIDPKLPTYIVFTFIDDHIRRVIGTSLQLQNFPGQYEKAPDFYLEKNELKMYPDFYQRFQLLRKINKVYSHTKFSRFTRLEFPFVSTYHYELIARIISEMKKEIQSVLPETREIYLATFLEQNYYAPSLLPHLQKEGVKVLDYSGINYPSLMGGHFYLKHDYHPSAKTHDLFGNLLVSDLKIALGFEKNLNHSREIQQKDHVP